MNKKTLYFATSAIFATFIHTNHCLASPEVDKCIRKCFAKIGGASNYCGTHFPDESLRTILPEVVKFTSQDCSRQVYLTWRDDPNPSLEGVMVRACDVPCKADPKYSVMDDQRFKDKVLKVLTEENQKYVARVQEYDKQNPNEKNGALWTGRPEGNVSFNRSLEDTINSVIE